jgi:hypothetical protein
MAGLMPPLTAYTTWGLSLSHLKMLYQAISRPLSLDPFCSAHSRVLLIQHVHSPRAR